MFFLGVWPEPESHENRLNKNWKLKEASTHRFEHVLAPFLRPLEHKLANCRSTISEYHVAGRLLKVFTGRETALPDTQTTV